MALGVPMLAVGGSAACSGEISGPDVTVVIVRQPTRAVVGKPLVPGVEVRVTDGRGRPLTGRTSIDIDPNPCDWRLGGTTQVDVVDGRATFSDVRFQQVGKEYRLAVRFGASESVTEPIEVSPTALPARELVLETTLCSKPNPQRDAESIAYVGETDSFWLADDDAPSIFEVDRRTGRHLFRVAAASFVDAFPAAGECDDNDGDPLTSCSYTNEFEHLAYDQSGGLLYVMNTQNRATSPGAPQVDRPALFRLRRAGTCSSCWTFESWRALPEEPYTAMVTIDGLLYMAIGQRLYGYDYEANRLLTTSLTGDSLPAALVVDHGIRRLHFDGTDLWMIVRPLTIKRLSWSSKIESARYDLAPYGVRTPSGLEIVDERLYVLEGEAPNPIYVFHFTEPPQPEAAAATAGPYP